MFKITKSVDKCKPTGVGHSEAILDIVNWANLYSRYDQTLVEVIQMPNFRRNRM